MNLLRYPLALWGQGVGRIVSSMAVVGVALAVVAGAAASTVQGQTPTLGDSHQSYLRMLDISGLGHLGSWTIRRPDGGHGMDADRGLGGDSVWAHPWGGRLRTEPSGSDAEPVVVDGESRLRLFGNSRLPRGGNDGPVWQGRGLTTAADASVGLRWRGLSATFNPTLIHNQNAAFDLAPVQPAGQPIYAYPWRRIDYPQRYGPDSYWTFDLGESQIALDWRAARLSFGNESMWWGPGIRNAIVMSNNAPGFLHASLATNRPVDIGIGQLEGQWIWGGLEQSKYVDSTAETDRYITGIVLAYSPSWLEGLTVGGTRLFQAYRPADGLPVGDYLLVFQGLTKTSQISEEQPEGNDEADQMASLFARWVFPESGAEVYVEWARTDHALDLEDFLQEPEHSQGYTLGLQKVTSRSEDRIFVLTGELTHLESAATFQLRPRPTYYQHGVVTQGHTNRGQILGAWIGPGGNSQFLGFEMFAPWGSSEVFLQRQVHDNDAFWVWAEANDQTFDAHHVSFDLGVQTLIFRGDFEFGGGAMITRQINRWFFGPHLWNLNLSLSARWRPGMN
ncbi:MAG: capsule assembly Wzi family protein [Longimicrobiales bacterium]|nr:capsule assembly Wzi family protein [Longimicrobiales bacterium]